MSNYSLLYDNKIVPRRKERIHIIQYIFLFVIILLGVLGSSSNEALDMSRIIETAEENSSLSLNEIIRYYYREQKDFIFYVILYIITKLSLSISFVLSLFILLYYIVIIKMIRNVSQINISNQIFLAVVFATPMMWTINIVRNVIAVTVLFLAINCLLEKKRFYVLVLCVLAVLVHFSALMYIALFTLCWLFQNVKIKPRLMFLVLGAIIIVSLMLPTQLFIVIDRFLHDTETRYVVYSGVKETGRSFFSLTNISLGDKLSILYAYLYSIVLLLLNKKQGFSYWCLFILIVMLSFFLNSSQLFVQRFALVLPLFMGINMVAVLENTSANNKRTINILSWLGVLLVLLCLYLDRVMFGLS